MIPILERGKATSTNISCVCVCLCVCVCVKRERMCVYTDIHICVCRYKTDVNLFPLGNKIVLLGAKDNFMIYVISNYKVLIYL